MFFLMPAACVAVVLGDLGVELKIIGAELYRFVQELHIGNYMVTSTNAGLKTFLEAILIVYKHIRHFYQSYLLHSRPLSAETCPCLEEFGA